MLAAAAQQVCGAGIQYGGKGDGDGQKTTDRDTGF